MKKVALAILAAGASRRFGSEDKLLALWRGRPLLAHALGAFRSAPVARRFAVVQDRASAAAEICREFGFEPLENRSAVDGIAGSIAVAARHSDGFDGLMIALGDMPLIKERTIASLLVAYDDAASDPIVAPTHDGRHGHPVTFSGCYFPELAALTGDRGAGSVIEEHKERLVTVPVDDEGVTIDFDHPESFSGP